MAGIISFLLPPKWEVDAIIVPSRLLYRSGGGTLSVISFMHPKSIANLINQSSYNNSIATELKIDIHDVPKLKAENPTGTTMVKVSTKVKDVEKAKLILNSLFNLIKSNSDKNVDRERKRIDSQIETKEIKKLIHEEEIKALKNRLNIIGQRKKEVEKEMNEIRKKNEELEKERRLILEKKSRSESESFALLLFSNGILQNSLNRNMLNELLGSKRIEEENINLEIKDKERLINQIKKEITELNVSKGRIYYSQITKEPTSSISPVSPNKKFNVVIAGILGLIIFTVIAFTLEHLKKYKPRAKIK